MANINWNDYKLSKPMFGIDVSIYQFDGKNILDWNSATTDTYILDGFDYVFSGIDFVIMKAGGGEWSGGPFEDIRFQTTYAACENYSLYKGCYWYFGSTDKCNSNYTEAEIIKYAEREADFFWGIIKDKTFELPVYLDIESNNATNVDSKKLTAAIKAFINELEYNMESNPDQPNNYIIGLYTYLGFFGKFDNNEFNSDYPRWIAGYMSRDVAEDSPWNCDFNLDSEEEAPTFNIYNGYKGILGAWQFGGEANFLRSNLIGGDVCDQNLMFINYPAALDSEKYINKSNFTIGTKVTSENIINLELPKFYMSYNKDMENWNADTDGNNYLNEMFNSLISENRLSYIEREGKYRYYIDNVYIPLEFPEHNDKYFVNEDNGGISLCCVGQYTDNNRPNTLNNCLGAAWGLYNKTIYENLQKDYPNPTFLYAEDNPPFCLNNTNLDACKLSIFNKSSLASYARSTSGTPPIGGLITWKQPAQHIGYIASSMYNKDDGTYTIYVVESGYSFSNEDNYTWVLRKYNSNDGYAYDGSPAERFLYNPFYLNKNNYYNKIYFNIKDIEESDSMLKLPYKLPENQNNVAITLECKYIYKFLKDDGTPDEHIISKTIDTISYEEEKIYKFKEFFATDVEIQFQIKENGSDVNIVKDYKYKFQDTLIPSIFIAENKDSEYKFNTYIPIISSTNDSSINNISDIFKNLFVPTIKMNNKTYMHTNKGLVELKI